MVEEWLLLTGPTRTRMGVSCSEAVRPPAGNKRCVREGFCQMSDWVNDDKNLFPLYRPWNIVESKRDFFFFHSGNPLTCIEIPLNEVDLDSFTWATNTCSVDHLLTGEVSWISFFHSFVFYFSSSSYHLTLHYSASLSFTFFFSHSCVCVQVLWDPSRALRHISQQWTWALHKRWLPWATTRAVCVSTATHVSGQGWVPDEMQYLYGQVLQLYKP